MAVPKKKNPKSRKGKRRSHLALRKISLSECSKCKKPVLPHTACYVCGTYKGREVIKIKIKKTAKQKERGKKEKK